MAKNENLKIWDAIKQPPPTALRQIQGGRLRGKTDINPQWRYQAMTEQFGICGIGWKYEVVRVWSEEAPQGQRFAFAEILLYVIKDDGQWSDGIPGYGGSMLVESESSGLHASDEGYKMAITDALSVAMKMLGIAADIYMNLWDGSKYKDGNAPPKQSQVYNPPKQQERSPFLNEEPKPTGQVPMQEGIPAPITQAQMRAIQTMLGKMEIDDDYARHEKVARILGLDNVPASMSSLTKDQASKVISALSEEAK